MIRTSIGIVVLVAAILWLPLWTQLVLFVGAIIVLRYRLFILIPAVFADALYAPDHLITPAHFKTTIVVGVLLGVWFVITTQTRLGNQYAYTPK